MPENKIKHLYVVFYKKKVYKNLKASEAQKLRTC